MITDATVYKLQSVEDQTESSNAVVPPPSTTDPEVVADSEDFNVTVSELEAFEFDSPAELLLFIYPNLNPHKWQIEEHRRIAANYDKQDPLLYALCTCNSSGKDSYIVAPTVAWLTLCRKRHRTILTSSSGTQLTTQTEQLVADIFRAFNSRVGEQVVRIRQRRIRCAKTGSEVILFATDEAGKAEGYHPFPDYPQAEMCIVVNEAKSVQKIIFDALSRCEGYSRWIEVSSPGGTNGHFYEVVKNATNYPEELVRGKWFTRKITAFDCPHVSKSHIENMRVLHGENSDLYRSSILADFTSANNQVVITHENIRKCLDRKPNRKTFGKKRAGLDLAAGGDENVLSIWWGNVFLGQECFREKDTTKAVSYLIRLFLKWGLEEENIYADDGGVGRGMIDQLAARGWKVNRVLNQSPSITREYVNRGAEMWFRFSRFIQECLLRFDVTDSVIPDSRLFEQLTNRYYERSETTGRIKLEGKAECRAQGRPSPDRADACVLAFTAEDLRDYLAEVMPQGYGDGERKGLKGEAANSSMTNVYTLPTQEVLVKEMMKRDSEAYNALRSRALNTRSILDAYYEGVI